MQGASDILYQPVPDIDAPILKPRRYVERTSEAELERQREEERRREIRELEEMLGLRRTRNIPEIKVLSPEEEEREKYQSNKEDK